LREPFESDEGCRQDTSLLIQLLSNSWMTKDAELQSFSFPAFTFQSRLWIFQSSKLKRRYEGDIYSFS